jgi:hypothetical protein
MLPYCWLTMNKADSERIHQLCSLIIVEQDQQKFIALVEELNRILDAKEERLQKKQDNEPTVI